MNSSCEYLTVTYTLLREINIAEQTLNYKERESETFISKTLGIRFS